MKRTKKINKIIYKAHTFIIIIVHNRTVISNMSPYFTCFLFWFKTEIWTVLRRFKQQHQKRDRKVEIEIKIVFCREGVVLRDDW